MSACYQAVRKTATWGLSVLAAMIGMMVTPPTLSAQEPETVMPEVIRQVKPDYPFGLRRSGAGGRVTVAFVVDTKGRVAMAHAVKSTHPSFRAAALEAVKQWRFKPGTVDGKKAPVRMQVPIIFNIQGVPENSGWKVTRPREYSEATPEAFRWHEAPVLLDLSPPVYPRQALLEKRKGEVTVRFVVGPDGRVMETMAIGEADEDLKAAAQAAVQTYGFKPPRNKEGQLCGAILSMDFDFALSIYRSDAPYNSEMIRLLKVLGRDAESLPTLNDLDAVPEPIGRRAPVIPPSVKRAGKPARAMVEFVINRDGLALLPRVVETTDEEFGYAAVQAVADWGFTPPLIDGKTVDVLAKVPVTYNPSDAE